MEDDLRETVSHKVGTIIADLLDEDAIVDEVMESLGDDLRLKNPEEFIRGRFEQKPAMAWDAVVDLAHFKRVRESQEDIKNVVQEALVTRVTEEQTEAEEEG